MLSPAHIPQRILMTADAVGGVWTYAMELVRGLASHDVFVTLATMGAPPSEAQTREAAELSNLEIEQSSYKLEWMEDPWEDVRKAGDWLLEIEQRVQPDLIHLNGYAHGALPWSAPVIVVGHSCVLSWWKAVKGEEAPEEWSRYRKAVSAGLQAADAVVAPSHWMLDRLQHWYGPLSDCCIIYNGRELTDHFPVKEPMIFAAGRLWDEAKNIRLLAQVAPELDWPVVVAGSAGPVDGRLSNWPSVRRLGHLDRNELSSWLSRAAIYAFPAKYEPFGLSILEAALARCALVLGDMPSLREIWRDAAIYVPPDSPESLRDALKMLTAAPSLCDELGDRAHARSLEFTPGRMVDGYFAAYSRVMAKAQEVSRQPAEVMA